MPRPTHSRKPLLARVRLGSTVGGRRLQRLVLGLVTASLLLSVPVPRLAAVELPDIGDAGAGLVSADEERRIGAGVLRNIRQARALIDDPLVNEYINDLGYRLVSGTAAHSTEFTFFVVRDPSVNAFALPGGYIGLHHGLILTSKSESELGSVVAHEIAHVTQRHYARTYEVASGQQWVTAAAIIAAIILGSQSPEAGQAAMAGITAGSIQSQINFTRANEKEADRVGIDLLADAGLDPNAMGDFFGSMHRASRLYGSEGPEFLRTHPVTDSRIADARGRAAQHAQTPVSERLAYHLARERVRVLTAESLANIVRDYEYALKTRNYRSEEATKYGYALALLAMHRSTEARAVIESLLDNDPQRIAYLVTQADIESDLGNVDRALSIYENTLRVNPTSAPLTMFYANTLMAANQHAKAKLVLRDYLRSHDAAPVYYKLLSEAESHSGEPVEAQVALSEYFYRMGQVHEAINQLQLAQQHKSLDFYQSSRIEARLAELKDEVSQTPQ